MRLRIRGPSGQSVVSFDDTKTVDNLRKTIATETSLITFDIKYGYPPKTLPLDEYTASTLLCDLDVKLDGEQLIVSKKDAASTGDVTRLTQPANATTPHNASSSSDAVRDLKPSHKSPTSTGETQAPASGSGFSFGNLGTAPPSKASARPTSRPAATAPSAPISLKRKSDSDALNDPPEVLLPDRGGAIVQRVMPDDNSCLFRAVASAVLPGMDAMNELRSVIASAVQANPVEYSKVVLDNQEPDDYCRWIQTEDAWGGQIELVILSKQFELEICSIDVKSGRIDKYNEGKPTRCILAYSGIHYDTIAFSRFNSPPEEDEKVFQSSEDEILDAAVSLCQKLKERGYYTDTAAFKIKCMDCGTISTGEKGATEHASKTGHYNMEEVRT
jgi:ubiquitin thioesterase OTU1